MPIHLDSSWRHELEQEIPEFAPEKKQRFIAEYGLIPKSADVLVSSREVADFFEETAGIHKDAKAVSNFILGEVLRYLSDEKITLGETKLTAHLLAELLQLVDKGTISLNVAKSVLPELAKTGISPMKVVEQRGLAQVSDESELSKIVEDVLEAHPAELQKYLDGKDQIMGFFVGQVMKSTKGTANPKVVNQILNKRLLARK